MANVKSRKTDQKRPVPACLFAGWLAGCAALAAMLALSAFIMSFFGLPVKAAKLLMLLSVSAGALTAGAVTARKTGRKFFLCGLVSGALLFGTVFLCALSGRLPVLSDLTRIPVCLAASMAGAVLGVPKSSSAGGRIKRR